MADNATLEKAREKVERYRVKLTELFGEKYRDDPRFQEIVEAVANGRAIWLVFSDYSEIDMDNTTPPLGDGRGVVW